MQVIVGEDEKVVAAIETITIDNYLAFSFVWEKDKGNVKIKSKRVTISQKIGLLSNLNKSKHMLPLRKDGADLVSYFTSLLKNNGWDFEKYPNPLVYVLFVPESKR
jgi:hypothetical protein